VGKSPSTARSRKWAVDAAQRQLATLGLQLRLRLLNRGGAHHVAEGHATEVELDVIMIGGRAVNRAAEQARGGDVYLPCDSQQSPGRRSEILDLDEEAFNGCQFPGRSARRGRRHPTLPRDGHRRTGGAQQTATLQPELPS